MQLVATGPARTVDAREHGRRKLSAPQIGHQVVTAVAMESGPAVGADVQAHPGAPALRATDPDRFCHALPRVIPKPRKLIGRHLTFDLTYGRRLGEGQIAAPGAVHTGNRTQR